MDIKKYEENKLGLNAIEKQALSRQKNNPISKEAKDTVVNSIATILNGVVIDYGIKLPGKPQYLSARIYQILIRYYQTLSIQEIKVAFELNAIGELDPYFKKKNNGMPDKEHYNMFSVEWVTKVLNAYRELKRTANAKTQNALPAPKGLSDDSKKTLKDYAFSTLMNNFLNYKQKGEASFSWVLPHIYINLLHDMGMPIEVPETPKKGHTMEAFVKTDDWHKKNRAIAACFDKIIEEGIDLRSVMLKHYKSGKWD